MKSAALIVCITSLALTTASGRTIAASGPGSGSSPPTSASPTAAPQPSAAALFKSFAGEWEGSIQTRNAEGVSSSSLASASCRLEENGARMSCAYEGFAFGQPTNGALVLTAPPGNQPPRAALSRSDTTMSGAGKVESNALVFSFERTERGKTTRFEQTITAPESNRLVVQLSSFDASGRKSQAWKLDLTRLADKQQSSAAELFASSKPLAAARSAVQAGTQRAGVDTE